MNYTIRFPDGYVKLGLPGRDLWVAALRSGKFQQGIGALSDKGLDCCLGVLCKVQGRPSDFVWVDGTHQRFAFDDEHLVLQPANPLFDKLQKSGDFPAGLTVITEADTATPLNKPGGFHGSLACCNDGHLTFLQIADIIEAVWDNDEPNWPE